MGAEQRDRHRIKLKVPIGSGQHVLVTLDAQDKQTFMPRSIATVEGDSRTPNNASPSLFHGSNGRTQIDHGIRRQKLPGLVLSDTGSSRRSERRSNFAHFQQSTGKNRPENRLHGLEEELQDRIPQEARASGSDTSRSGSITADSRKPSVESRLHREDSDREKELRTHISHQKNSDHMATGHQTHADDTVFRLITATRHYKTFPSGSRAARTSAGISNKHLTIHVVLDGGRIVGITVESFVWSLPLE